MDGFFFSFVFVPVLSDDGVAARIENLLCFVGLADDGAAGTALLLLEFATHCCLEMKVVTRWRGV